MATKTKSTRTVDALSLVLGVDTGNGENGTALAEIRTEISNAGLSGVLEIGEMGLRFSPATTFDQWADSYKKIERVNQSIMELYKQVGATLDRLMGLPEGTSESLSHEQHPSR